MAKWKRWSLQNFDARVRFPLAPHLNIWARGSVVERHTDNVKVDGSIPSEPTLRNEFEESGSFDFAAVFGGAVDYHFGNFVLDFILN